SSRIGGGGGASSGSALCSVAVSGACHGVVVLLGQASVGCAGSTGAFGGDDASAGGEGGGAGSGSGAAYGAGRSAGRFSAAGNASMTPSFTRPERRVSVCIFPRRSCSAIAATSRSPLTASSARQRSGVNVTAP